MILEQKPLTNRASITSKALETVGSDIHATSEGLVCQGRFRGVATEDLLPVVSANAPTPQTREYLELRYGGIA